MVLCGGSSGAFVVFRSSFATCIIKAAAEPGRPLKLSLARKGDNTNENPTLAEEGLRTDFTEIITDADKNVRASESLVSGILTSIRGVATVCSGLIGKALVTESQHLPLRSDEYAEGRWKNLVLFTGITMAGSSLGALAVAKWSTRRSQR